MNCKFNLILLIIGILSRVCLATERTKDGKLKLVIDNDAGGDDAMAIFVALLYEKYYDGPQLVALTTGNGNTLEHNVCRNNQRILKVANRQNVPIYRGCKSSIVNTDVANFYYGMDGLGDTGETIPELTPAEEQNAVLRLIELSKIHEGELVIVTVGTLTNVALAMKLDPAFISRLAHLYVAAGHIYSDQESLPEFNAKMDPEAYHIMAQNARPDKITVVPFSQTKIYLNISKSWRNDVLGRIDNEIVREQNKYEKISLGRPGGQWTALDPAAVSAAIKPELVKEYKYSQNDIILCGEYKGINTNKFVEKEEANVRVIYSFHEEDYKKFLLDLFSRTE
ncbi:unnamed protein product [Chilo suppressalis]|uniref:Inosine/uridine-preferring nucleoside hydrolase domain-containing protein n=1 Tax=Chilo suppressalis TaxID=168631 RepID=A0ABN8B8Z9_CHISP|nr:unnamed protein product [Chilo suppressalis]